MAYKKIVLYLILALTILASVLGAQYSSDENESDDFSSDLIMDDQQDPKGVSDSCVKYDGDSLNTYRGTCMHMRDCKPPKVYTPKLCPLHGDHILCCTSDTQPDAAKLCGPDITRPLKVTMKKMEENFKKLSWTKRLQNCYSIMNPQKDPCKEGNKRIWLNAWDLLEIRYNYEDIDVMHKEKAGKPIHRNCAGTVRVGNQCHYSGSVNYVILGVIARLCNIEKIALNLVESYKCPSQIASMLNKGEWDFRHPDGSSNCIDSTAWTEAGMKGWGIEKDVDVPESDGPWSQKRWGNCEMINDADYKYEPFGGYLGYVWYPYIYTGQIIQNIPEERHKLGICQKQRGNK